VTDSINEHHREAYNRELCCLVSIFHDGRPGGLENRDLEGRVMRGNVCLRRTSGWGYIYCHRLGLG
jgi:hypothetical protein